MLTMNPATGQMEDDYGKEPAGGMVSQQDQAAATSPTFIGNGLPTLPAVPPPAAPSEPALGPNDVMPMSPDSVPPPVGAGDLPSPILDAGPSGPGAGEPTGSGTMPVVQIPDGGIEPISASGPGPNEVIPMSPDEGAPPITGAPGAEPPKPGEIEKPKALIDERIEAAKREGEVKAEIAKIEAEKAQIDLDQKVAAKKEEDDLIARSEQRIADGRARREAEYTKYRDMTVQDAWGDHGTAKRIMAALAMILGGRNGMAVAIGAAQGLEEKKKTELALQEKVMANAGKSLEEIKDQTAEEMADFKTRQAAAFGVTAARLEQEKRAQGIPEAKIAADQDVLKLRAEEEKAKRDAAKLAIDTENERLKMDLTKAQTRQANSAADKNDRYVQKGGRGAGGGHGGVGLAAGAQKVADAITNGVENDDGTRRELTPKEKMAVATANGIKLNGKSSETTLDSINKMVAFDANAARKAAGKGGTGDADAIKNSFKPFRTEAIGTPRSPGPVAELSKIEEMRKTLDDAAKSGDTDKIKTAMVKAKEQAGTLMSGGKMTVAQVKIMHDLESKVDEFVSTYGKWTGNPTEGAGAVRRLTGLIETAGDETAARVKSIRDRALEQHLAPGGAANTPEKKRAFENENAGVFSGAEWRGKRLFQEGEKAATRQGGGPAPQAKSVSSGEKAKAMKWLADHPGDPMAAAVREKLQSMAQ